MSHQLLGLAIFLIDPAERIRPRSSRSVAAMVSYFFFFGAGLTFTALFGELIRRGPRICLSAPEAATGTRSPSEVLDDLGELSAPPRWFLAVLTSAQNLFFEARM